MFRILFILLCFLFSPAWAVGNDLAQLTQTAVSRLSKNNQANIESLNLSACSTGFTPSISFHSAHSNIEFKVQINSEISSPQVTFDSISRTLQIPSLETLTADPFPEPLYSAFKTWLIGHEFHPYSSGFSTAKSSQKTALQASTLALQQEADSLLIIAPTGMGKTYVLVQTLMKQIREFSSHQKVFFVTVHQMELIEQLLSQLKEEQEKEEDFHIVDWRSLLDKSWQSFASEIKRADEQDKPTVLVVSSQSLTRKLRKLFNQTAKKYKDIQNTLLGSLGGIYIDEAHHLGADKTKSTLLELLNKSRSYQRDQNRQNEVFLYGTTATPVHYVVNLREFFEREHWAYLNKEDNLFEEHSVESVMEQLALGIDKGELTPFDDLYVIGEDSFKKLAQESELKETSIFMQSESKFYVINPDHYESLLRIMGPLLSSNKKGFIVTATIAEAERLQIFLNKKNMGIKFEAYHSQMEDSAKREVLEHSRSFESPHYIIAVRSLDEGVDLPHLSAYIDINLNVSIHQMIHRIGRVLRIFPGKQMADILFLTDYKDEQFAKDALSLLEQLEVLSFSGNDKKRKGSGDRDLRFKEAGITPMSREELLEMRDRLQESIQSFWLERYSLEDVPEAVKKLNEISPKTEQIISQTTYEKFRHKDPKLPSWPVLINWYEKENGNIKGLSKFVFGFAYGKELYSLEEVPEAIEKLNEISPATEQITSQRTYEKFRHKDPKLPSWSALSVWYGKKYKNSLELSLYEFIFMNQTKMDPYTLTLDERNENLEEAFLVNNLENQYAQEQDKQTLRKRIQKLRPSLNEIENYIVDYRFLSDNPQSLKDIGEKFKRSGESVRQIESFLLRRFKKSFSMPDFNLNNTPLKSEKPHTFKDILEAFAKLNEHLPDTEQITSQSTYTEVHHAAVTLGNKYMKPSPLMERTLRAFWLGTPLEPEPNPVKPYTLVEIPLALPYTLKEVPEVFVKLNESLPEAQQITSTSTYEELHDIYMKFFYKDPKLPSWLTLKDWYKKKYGEDVLMIDFLNFILNRTQME